MWHQTASPSTAISNVWMYLSSRSELSPHHKLLEDYAHSSLAPSKQPGEYKAIPYLWAEQNLSVASHPACGCSDDQQIGAEYPGGGQSRGPLPSLSAQDSRFRDCHTQPHWFRSQSYCSLALCQGSLLFQFIREFHKTIAPTGKNNNTHDI